MKKKIKEIFSRLETEARGLIGAFLITISVGFIIFYIVTVIGIAFGLWRGF